jgi:glycosyltransferase involved in cell wall biosynthesis
MKIALFHDTAGGSKHALFEQTRRLRARGHEFDLFSFTSTSEDDWDVRPLVKEIFRVPVRVLPGGRFATRWWPPLPNLGIELINYHGIASACAQLARHIHARDYDIAFTHQCRHTHTPPLLNQLRIPTVHFCQEPSRRFFEAIKSDLDDEPLDRDWRQRRPGLLVLASLERRALAAASRLLVNSQYSREYLAHVYNLPGSVCYLGVDQDRFRPVGEAREKLVLSVGALAREKGHGFVLRALACIPQHSRPKLVIIADRGVQDAADGLRDFASRLQVDLVIRLRVPEEELVRWYCRASVVACGQIFEPFGFIAIEAMACETPVVAVREGGFRESIIDKETGYLTNRDPREFAQQIELLLNRHDLRARLGKTAREWVLDRWTWDHVISDLERHLWAVAKKGPVREAVRDESPATPAP